MPLQCAQSLAGLPRGVPCARSFSSLLFPSAGDPWFKTYGDDQGLFSLASPFPLAFPFPLLFP